MGPCDQTHLHPGRDLCDRHLAIGGMWRWRGGGCDPAFGETCGAEAPEPSRATGPSTFGPAYPSQPTAPLLASALRPTTWSGTALAPNPAPTVRPAYQLPIPGAPATDEAYRAPDAPALRLRDGDILKRVTTDSQTYTYALHPARGLLVLDPFADAGPVELASLPLPGDPVDLYVNGGSAHVVLGERFTKPQCPDCTPADARNQPESWTGQLVSISIVKPETPQIVDIQDIPARPVYSRILENNLYVVGDTTVADAATLGSAPMTSAAGFRRHPCRQAPLCYFPGQPTPTRSILTVGWIRRSKLHRRDTQRWRAVGRRDVRPNRGTRHARGPPSWGCRAGRRILYPNPKFLLQLQ